MSLRTRIVLVASAAVALTVLAVAITNYATTRSELRGQVDDGLRARVEPLARFGLVDDVDGDGVPRPRFGLEPHDLRRLADVPFGGAPGALQLVTPDGTTQQPGPDGAKLPVDGRAREIARSGQGNAFSEGHVGDIHVRVLTVGAGARGALQVARPLTEVDHVLHRQLVVLAIVGGLGILGAGGVGWLVARTALAPVSRFTRRTEALTADPDITQRLDVTGRDEIARLAQSFNTTLDAL